MKILLLKRFLLTSVLLTFAGAAAAAGGGNAGNAGNAGGGLPSILPQNVTAKTNPVDAVHTIGKDAVNLGALLLAALLFLGGASLVVWSIYMVMSGRQTFADVALLLVIGATAGVAGTYFLVVATSIL